VSGRPETENVIPGRYALAVGPADMPAPPGWAWVRLSDIAQLETGHTPSRKCPEYWNGEVGWIGIKDAREHHGGVIHQTLQTVTQLGLENSAARLLPANTVCLSRTASVGYVVLMGKPMATSQDFVNWACSSALEPKFLLHLLIAENESLFRFGKGTTHTTIYFPEVKAFHVCLPPLAEQRRIVKRIEALQSRSRKAREALEAVPSLLEQLRQSVLAAAFRGDLTAEWRKRHPDIEPASALLERIHQERRRRWEEANPRKSYVVPTPLDVQGLPDLATGWEWCSLDELCYLITSGSRDWSQYYGRGTGTFIMAQNVRPGCLDFSEGRQAVDPPAGNRDRVRSQVCPGDLLITIVGANTGDMAPVTQVLPEHYVCQSVALIRPVFPGLQGCLLRYFQPGGLGRQHLDKVIYGQGRPHLGFDDLRAMPVPLAPLQEQVHLLDTIGRWESALQRVTGEHRDAVKEWKFLDQAILAKAFRGELIPQDPNDEPASALLERIRADRPEQAGRRVSRR
jgi:type I restriction enzyme S subunit